MIYIFENPNNDASIVYDGSTLTEEQKSKAVAVEQLPELQTPAGKQAVLKVRKVTGEVWYEYADMPADPELERLKQVVADLTELVLLGGMPQ